MSVWEWLWNSIIVSFPFAAVFTVLVFVFKQSIVEYFSKRITSKFDHSIEVLKSELSKRENENRDLRALILSDVGSRRNILMEKQLDAAETIWKAVNVYSTLKFVQLMHDRVDFDWVKKNHDNDDSIQGFFKNIGQGIDKENFTTRLNELDVQGAQPFVTELLWALYSAYSGIFMKYYVDQLVYENGAPPKIIADSENLKKLVLLAMPEQKTVFEKFEEVRFSIFLDLLENQILREIKRIFNGDQETQASIDRAMNIQNQLAKLNKES